MGRAKNIPASRLADLMEKVDDAAALASEITKAIADCRIDDLPSPESDARSILAASRTLLDLAQSLFMQCDLQDVRSKNAALEQSLK
jgi:hypothetical protein